jgi:hypothetical protein
VQSDWPGAWAEETRRRLLPGVIPLVLNGCCGNIGHTDVFNPQREDTPQSMARLLTDAVQTALTNPCFSEDDPVLACKTIRFGLPFRALPQGIFADAHKLIDEHPEPMWQDAGRTRFAWDWYFAASLLDLEHMLATQTELEYEIQGLRLGDLAVLVLPGEPFVEVQLDIKQRSPAKRTFLAHMSNRLGGYIPTPEAIRRGGYESRPSHDSNILVPDALQMIADRAVGLLQELYKGKG